MPADVEIEMTDNPQHARKRGLSLRRANTLSLVMASDTKDTARELGFTLLSVVIAVLSVSFISFYAGDESMKLAYVDLLRVVSLKNMAAANQFFTTPLIISELDARWHEAYAEADLRQFQGQLEVFDDVASTGFFDARERTVRGARHTAAGGVESFVLDTVSGELNTYDVDENGTLSLLATDTVAGVSSAPWYDAVYEASITNATWSAPYSSPLWDDYQVLTSYRPVFNETGGLLGAYLCDVLPSAMSAVLETATYHYDAEQNDESEAVMMFFRDDGELLFDSRGRASADPRSLVDVTSDGVTTVGDRGTKFVRDKWGSYAAVPGTEPSDPDEEYTYVFSGLRIKEDVVIVLRPSVVVQEAGLDAMLVLCVAKREFLPFLDTTITYTVLLCCMACAAVGAVYFAVRRSNQAATHRGTITRRATGVKAIELQSAVTDNVDWMFVFMCSITVVSVLMAYWLWQSQVVDAIETLALKLTYEANEAAVTHLRDNIETPVKVLQLMDVQMSISGAALTALAADAAGDACATSEAPSYVVEGSLLPGFALDIVDVYALNLRPVEAVTVGLTNSVAVRARHDFGSGGLEVMVSDATTTVLGVSAMRSFAVDTFDLSFNMSAPDSVVMATPYQPAEQPWWADNVANLTAGMGWTDGYTFVGEGDELGVSIVMRASSLADTYMAVDTSYQFIGEAILASSPTADATTEVGAFLTTTPDSTDLLTLLIASSDGTDIELEGRQLRADESDSEAVAAVASEINARVSRPSPEKRPAMFPDGLDTAQADTTCRYGADTVWVSLQRISDDHGLDWISVVTLGEYGFYEGIVDWDSINILVGIGCAGLSLALIYGFHSSRKRVDRRQKGGARSEEMMSNSTDPAYWRQLALDVELHVDRAKQMLDTGETLAERAKRYVEDSYLFDDRHVLETLAAEIEGEGSALPSWARGWFGMRLREKLCLRNLYYMYTTPGYRFVAHSAIWLHMAVALWEAPAYDASDASYYTEYGDNMLVFHGLCVVVHVVDLWIHLTIFGLNKRKSVTRGSICRTTVLRIVVVAMLLIDWIAVGFGGYQVDLAENELYIINLMPYTVVLRPVLLVLRNEEIQTALTNFLVTILLAKDVLVVGCSFLCIGVVMCITLLADKYDETAVGRNVDDYRSAFIFMFVFIFTSENYTSVVNPATNKETGSRWFRIYFLVLSYSGMFLLVSLIIGHFQEAYKNRLTTLKKRETKEHRLSMVVAFLMLDRDELTSVEHLFLEPDEYQEFFDMAGANRSTADMQSVSDSFLREDGNRILGNKVDILEFVSLTERMIYTDRFVFSQGYVSTAYDADEADRPAPAGAMPGVRQRKPGLNHSKKMQLVAKVVCVLNVWSCCLLGTSVGDSESANFTIIFVFYNVAETVVRMLSSEGPWTPPVNFLYKVSQRDPYRKAAHRFDFAVSCMTGLGYLYSCGNTGAGGLGEGAERVIVALPCLRIFSAFKTNRQLCFGLFSILKGFASLLALLAVAMYVYACVGIFFYSGHYEFMPEEVYADEDKATNFDSLSEAFGSLFQIMIGEGWDGVMGAAIDTHYGFAAAIYFCSYVALVTVLFSNLFVGIVCDAFSKLQSFHERQLHAEEGGAPLSDYAAKQELVGGADVHSDLLGRDMRSASVAEGATRKAALRLKAVSAFKGAGRRAKAKRDGSEDPAEEQGQPDDAAARKSRAKAALLRAMTAGAVPPPAETPAGQPEEQFEPEAEEEEDDYFPEEPMSVPPPRPPPGAPPAGAATATVFDTSHLERQIAELQRALGVANGDLDGLQGRIDERDEELERLRAELAEATRPRPRHQNELTLMQHVAALEEQLRVSESYRRSSDLKISQLEHELNQTRATVL